jgi:hypothetical protein
MLNELIIDPYRTKLIVNLVKDLILENRNIFIFTERRKHAAIIKLAMQKHIAINAINLMEEEGEKEVENDDGEEDGDEIEDDENDGDENNIEVENEVINNEIEIGGENDEAINNENVDEDELENKNNVNAYGEVIDKDFEKYLINSNFLNNKASILIGGVTAESERISEQNSNVIIATYHYLSTGRSIKKMDTIILAMPRKSKMLQTFGRIFRLNGDEKIHRKIYDIVDNMHKVKAQYYHRKKIAMEEYKSNVETKVVYNYDQII